MRSVISWLLISCSIVHAFTLRGYIPLQGILSNITLDPSARISVDHGERYSLIKQDGTFEVHNLIEGQYTLAPQVTGYIFASVSTTNHCQALSRCKGAYLHPESMSKCIIEVNKRELIRQYLLNLAPSTSPETPNILEPHLQLVLPGKSPLPSSSGSSLPHPLQISPLGQEDYYTARSGVDVLGMLKSPLVLMMLFSGVMMFALPKLMASVDADPELKKEMAEARKRMTGMQNGLSSMLTGGEERSAAAGVTSVAPSSGAHTPKGNTQKRRGR